MSIAGPRSASLNDAIEAAIKAGVIVVTAAGESSTERFMRRQQVALSYANSPGLPGALLQRRLRRPWSLAWCQLVSD